MHKIWKSLITAIYCIGVIIVFVLLAFIVSQSHIVLFPDAMLPMELHELASTWLAFGDESVSAARPERLDNIRRRYDGG